MQLPLKKVFNSKIHRAKITECDLNYEGSIKIDKTLLDASGIEQFEAVWVWNINNGERLLTYALEGEANSGVISLNGAAARLASVGDLVIITTFIDIPCNKVKFHQPTIALVDDNNKIKI